MKACPRTPYELSLPPHWQIWEENEADDEIAELMDPEVDLQYKEYHPDTINDGQGGGAEESEPLNLPKTWDMEQSSMLEGKRSRTPSARSLENWSTSNLPTDVEYPISKAAPDNSLLMGQGNE